MIEIMNKSGKRIGKISDSISEDDIVVIDGKEFRLTDVYEDEKLRKNFNKAVKDLKDVVK